MTYKNFRNKLSELGLRILVINDNQWSIGYPKIANPMLYFNPQLEEKDYMGSVQVKAINLRLFDANEIKSALLLVDELLLTDKSKRGEIDIKF